MKQNLPGGSSAVVPPDPMPNSEVKRRSADGSVGSPHVRVGNCQASNSEKAHPDGWAFLRLCPRENAGWRLCLIRPAGGGNPCITLSRHNTSHTAADAVN